MNLEMIGIECIYGSISCVALVVKNLTIIAFAVSSYSIDG